MTEEENRRKEAEKLLKKARDLIEDHFGGAVLFEYPEVQELLSEIWTHEALYGDLK